MDFLQTVVTALVQGLTEYLPISSSAHLILVPHLFGWTDQGLAFDVAVHVGSLAAVLTYFRRELAAMIRAWFGQVVGGPATADSRLAWAVIIGTLPVVAAGLLINEYADHLRDPLVIAAATGFFALVLWWADRRARAERDEYNLTWRQVLWIGFAQVLALIPGTSRSGITITAGLALGLSRRAAARFSFLLAIPVILAAGSLKSWELLTLKDPTPWSPMLLGVLVSGLAAYACIHWFLKLVERVGMLPFVLYRLLLAGVVLIVYI
jgi:undecaprenyl-diphosphatase